MPIPNISLTFDEGRYFDVWMLVHLLSGVTGAFSNVFFGFSGPVVMLLGIALMIVWEVVELMAGVREAWSNRILDLAYGVVGILAALWAAGRLERTAELVAFAVSFVIFAVGDVMGWLAYRRRRALT